MLIRKHISALVRVLAGLPAQQPRAQSRHLAIATQEALGVVSDAVTSGSWTGLDFFISTTKHELSRTFVANLRSFLVERDDYDVRVIGSDCVVVGASGPVHVYWTSLVYPSGARVVLPTLVKRGDVTLEARAILGLQACCGPLTGLPDRVNVWSSLNLFSGESYLADGDSLTPFSPEELRFACAKLSMPPPSEGSLSRGDFVGPV